MKRILLFSVLAIFFVSCADNSPKGKIEKAFREYVKKNFDDPKSLEEITSVDVIDTINIHDFISDIGKLIMICEKKDSVCEETYSMITNAVSSIRNFRSNNRVSEKYSKYIDDVNKRRNTFIWKINKKEGYTYKDNFQNMIRNTSESDTIILCSEIKYRIKEESGVKLKSIYALHDTLYNNTQIYKSMVDVKEYADKLLGNKNLDETAKDFMKLIELYEEEYIQSMVVRTVIQTELGVIIE